MRLKLPRWLPFALRFLCLASWTCLAFAPLPAAAQAPGAPMDQEEPWGSSPTAVADERPNTDILLLIKAGPRPLGTSVGIGAGYLFPQDLMIPNVVGVRFRLPSALTFEPLIVVDHRRGTQEDTALGPAGERVTTDTRIRVESAMRLPLASRGPVDLIGIGSLGFQFSRSAVDPAGPANDLTTRQTALQLGYGIGLEYFLRSHWSLSLDALNPIFTYTQTRQTNEAANTTAESTDLRVGVVFAPTVRLLMHLYF